MEHEHNLARRIIDVHDDFVDQGSDNPLFEPHVRRRVVPQPRQVLGEGVQRPRIDLLLRDTARIEGRQPRFDVAYPFERRIPARFQFAGDESLLGIDPFVATGRETRVVARLLELERQRLPLRAMLFVTATGGFDGRLDRLRFEGAQNLLGDDGFDTRAWAGHAGRISGLVMATHAPEIGTGAVPAAVTDLEGVAAPSAPQEPG